MTSPIRAISLDVDGTLYRVPRLRVAWRLRYERGLLFALLAAREKMRHEAPFADLAALEAREVELVAPSFSLPLAEAKARLIALRAVLPDALTDGVAPYPGVASALEAAHARGIRLAVLSDYDPGRKLSHLGLDRLPFQVVLGADGCGALKPHPRAFLLVAERLGLAPDQILHIGDREDLDVEGALKAGFQAWRFAPRGKVVSRAQHIFARWSVDLFKELL